MLRDFAACAFVTSMVIACGCNTETRVRRIAAVEPALALGAHACAVVEGGAVRCWGGNESGQLGYGDVEERGSRPGDMPVPDVMVGGKGVNVAVGLNPSCVLLEGGAFRCWGRNIEGERRSFSVIMQPPFGWNIRKHRIGNEKDATARLHLATGGFADDLRRSPDATLIAYVDGRTPEARADYELLEGVVVSDLRRLGHAALADRIDRDLSAARQIQGLDEFSRIAIKKMVEIGIPAAVFVESIRSPRSTSP